MLTLTFITQKGFMKIHLPQPVQRTIFHPLLLLDAGFSQLSLCHDLHPGKHRCLYLPTCKMRLEKSLSEHTSSHVFCYREMFNQKISWDARDVYSPWYSPLATGASSCLLSLQVGWKDRRCPLKVTGSLGISRDPTPVTSPFKEDGCSLLTSGVLISKAQDR